MVVDAYEAAIAKVMAAQEAATAAFPPESVGGLLLHIFEDSPHRWEVWVNTPDGTFTGLCVGTGPTQAAAVASARIALLALTGHLAKMHLLLAGYPSAGTGTVKHV